MSSSSTSASHTCGACGKTSPAVSAICARCESAYYCDRNCQKAHWKAHKPNCQPPSQTASTNTSSSTVNKTKTGPKKSTATPTSSSSAINAKTSITSLIADEQKSSSTSSSSSSSKHSAPVDPASITFSLPSTATIDHPLLAMRDIPGKGRGFVATAAIEPGTLLLTEQSIYAHSEGVTANEERRIATLVALTRMMLEKYPTALSQLCQHADHELPEHRLIDEPPQNLPSPITADQWHEALCRVDSNQFSSSRGMMCSPLVSITNHSCYPNADLIIKEVQVPGSTNDDPSKTVEQVNIYAIQPIAKDEEVTINYLGQDSLCRWYSPSMIRQESFQSQWQFTCTCLRCQGSKGKAIDKTIIYSPNGMDEDLELKYSQLVLSDEQPEPHALLQFYRLLFNSFDGQRFYYHYLLHQLRTMLIFMPVAFDENEQRKPIPANLRMKGMDGKPVPELSGESEWLELVQHHLQTLGSHLLNPPLHSIKSDTIQVILKSTDFIGQTFSALNSNKDGEAVKEHTELREKVVRMLQEIDDTYLEEPVFAQLYPETHALLTKYAGPTPVYDEE